MLCASAFASGSNAVRPKEPDTAEPTRQRRQPAIRPVPTRARASALRSRVDRRNTACPAAHLARRRSSAGPLHADGRRTRWTACAAPRLPEWPCTRLPHVLARRARTGHSRAASAAAARVASLPARSGTGATSAADSRIPPTIRTLPALSHLTTPYDSCGYDRRRPHDSPLGGSVMCVVLHRGAP
jgi:hypothetical protein